MNDNVNKAAFVTFALEINVRGEHEDNELRCEDVRLCYTRQVSNIHRRENDFHSPKGLVEVKWVMKEMLQTRRDTRKNTCPRTCTEASYRSH